MTFRITLERLPLRLDFEVGSIAEGVAALQEQDTQLHKFLAIADTMATDASEAGGTGEATTTETPKGKPGRKPKNQSDPATATAPPPLAIPAAAAPPTAPVDTAAVNPNGMPAFLDRTTPAPAAAAPPPPPAPPAPPAAPVVPPSGILAGKVIANLDQRKAGTPDGGKSLADWLAQCGLTTAGASYDEAIAVVRLTTDDKLATIAGQLGVS